MEQPAEQPQQQYYMVTAVIRPNKLDEVKDALSNAGILGMTVTEAKGRGRHGASVEEYRGGKYTLDWLPHLKLEIIVEGEELRNRARETIMATADTGKRGDGRVWTYAIDEFLNLL